MKKNSYIFLFLWTVCLFAGEKAWAEVSPPQGLSGSKIIYKFKNRESAGSFLSPQNIVMSQWIIKDLMDFEKEIHDSYFLRSANFEFAFNEEGNPFPFKNFKIKAFRLSEDGKETFARNYQVEEARINDARLGYLRLRLLDDSTSLQVVFHVYNFRYDPNGNILDRAILKTTQEDSFGTNDPFLKFQEGLWIEYRDYNDSLQPSSLSLKTFILSKEGSKIWLETKESQRRRFNEQGFITQETTRITTYSYSGLSGETYAVYNVELHPSGELNSYEIVFPRQMDVPFSEQENLEINFKRNEKGEILEKMVRKYNIENRSKKYIKGVVQEFTPEGSKIIKMKEISFDIKAGMSGILDEERVPQQAIYIWNLVFSEKGDILARKVLQTSFSYPMIHGVEEKLEMLQSYKNINLLRDQGKGLLKELSVDYFDFQKDRSFVPVRRVRIEILEWMPTGDPSKIKLLLQSPFDPDSSDEQIIIQDCNYIINEAVMGKLFDQRQNRPFDVDLKEVSLDGDILKVIFYEYILENHVKKYTRQEEFLVGDKSSSLDSQN